MCKSSRIFVDLIQKVGKMKQRRIKKIVQGRKTIDGAGVKLVRVLSHHTTELFDPFLMLDSFDSNEPSDYLAGFPTHPHRGIETITYLIEGKIEHQDSLGNSDVILPNESQWMTAGSGIMHQEMPQASSRMLGFQLWLNLAAKDKMCEPAYLAITKAMIPTVSIDGAKIHIIAGQYQNTIGTQAPYVPATIFDIELTANKQVEIPTDPDDTVFVFTILNNCMIEDQMINEKSAVLFEQGEKIIIKALLDDARIIYFAAKPLHEPISWGGPIVMNTQAELDHAFSEIRNQTFIKHYK